jgi:hypothetical protein
MIFASYRADFDHLKTEVLSPKVGGLGAELSGGITPFTQVNGRLKSAARHRGARHCPLQTHAAERAPGRAGHVRHPELDCAPCRAGGNRSFQHFDAGSLPVIEDGGLSARVIAGTAFGKKSPVGMLSPWLYAEVLLEPEASAPLDPDHEERAIYVVDGEVEIAGESFTGPRLLIFRPGDRITVRARRRARLIGGSAIAHGSSLDDKPRQYFA